MQAYNTWSYVSQDVENSLTETQHDSLTSTYRVTVDVKESISFNQPGFKGAVYAPGCRLSIPCLVRNLMSNIALLTAAVVSFWI